MAPSEATTGWSRRAQLGRVLVGLVTVLALGGGASPIARAGTYDVPACDAAGGVNNSWVPYSNNPNTPAYTACPSGRDPNRGMVARNAVGGAGARVPAGTTAMMIFSAPAGASIIGIRAAYRFSKTDGPWQVALSTGSQIVAGCSAGPFGCATSTNDVYLPVPGSSQLYIEAFCAYAACYIDSTGDPSHAYLQATANLYSAVVRVQDDVTPSIGAQSGSLLTAGWHRGANGVVFDANDNAGIRATRVFIDDRELSHRSKPCDFTRTVPCPQGGDEHTIDTSTARPDGSHRVRIEVEDAAGNVGAVNRDVLIDNTAPDPPRELAVDGGSGWRSANDFDLNWKLPTQGTGAPIAGLGFELCALPQGPCQRGSKDGRNLTSLADLKLPTAGEHVLKLWLRDEAGNEDRRLAAPEITLRYDDVSPELAFEPLADEDPTRLVVKTSDAASGVAGGQIEMRRQGRERWLSLPTSLDGTRLVARVDDERLGDGTFQLRARAVDRAGNERSTDRRADGKPAEIVLPVRLKTRLRAGVVRRKSRRAHLARSAFVRYGEIVRVRGRLTTPERNSLQGVVVQAWTQIKDRSRPPRLIATVRTSRTGRFSFLVRRGPSRTIRIRYVGTAHIRSATRVVVLNVRSRTTFRPNRRLFIAGETVRFRGRIRTGRIPEQGKLVEVQVRVRGRWRTFGTTRAGRRGRWHYDYRFDGTHGRVRYRFRAKVPREAGYPFATGRSRVVRVRVRGL